jgi:hypothetical protein
MQRLWMVTTLLLKSEQDIDFVFVFFHCLHGIRNFTMLLNLRKLTSMNGSLTVLHPQDSAASVDKSGMHFK